MESQRGSVLVLSYLALALMELWAAVGWQRSVMELRAAEQHVQTLQAFHLAEAGVDQASRWLRSQGAPPSGTNRFDPLNGFQPMERGRFSVVIDPDDANPTSFLDLFSVEATGEMTGVQISRRVTKLLRSESFARYSYFTNSERLLPGNTRIWFISRDLLEGPVHSNDQFNIFGGPVFNGPVTSAASSINYQSPPPSGGNHPAFNGGMTLNATPIQMPTSVTQLRLAASSSGGAWFTGNTTLTLRGDGTMLVTNPARGLVDMPQPLPANGAVFVNGGNVTVSGTLDGQLTIGTNRDLLIANTLVYADDPRVNPQSNDILGLVAEQNVVVSRSAPSSLTIQASLMALNSSFTVEGWWQGPPKGTLSVYGGILQKSRGPVGTFSSSTGNKLSGYSKDYRYDTRLSGMAPPFYPTTADYEEVLWRDEN